MNNHRIEYRRMEGMIIFLFFCKHRIVVIEAQIIAYKVLLGWFGLQRFKPCSGPGAHDHLAMTGGIGKMCKSRPPVLRHRRSRCLYM